MYVHMKIYDQKKKMTKPEERERESLKANKKNAGKDKEQQAAKKPRKFSRENTDQFFN